MIRFLLNGVSFCAVRPWKNAIFLARRMPRKHDGISLSHQRTFRCLPKSVRKVLYEFSCMIGEKNSKKGSASWRFFSPRLNGLEKTQKGAMMSFVETVK